MAWRSPNWCKEELHSYRLILQTPLNQDILWKRLRSRYSNSVGNCVFQMRRMQFYQISRERLAQDFPFCLLSFGHKNRLNGQAFSDIFHCFHPTLCCVDTMAQPVCQSPSGLSINLLLLDLLLWLPTFSEVLLLLARMAHWLSNAGAPSFLILNLYNCLSY